MSDLEKLRKDDVFASTFKWLKTDVVPYVDIPYRVVEDMEDIAEDVLRMELRVLVPADYGFRLSREHIAEACAQDFYYKARESGSKDPRLRNWPLTICVHDPETKEWVDFVVNGEFYPRFTTVSET